MVRARGSLDGEAGCYRDQIATGRCSRPQPVCHCTLHITLSSYTRFEWRTGILFGRGSYLPYSTNELHLGLPGRHTFLTSRYGRTLVQKRISNPGSFYWPVRPTIALCKWHGYSLPQETPTARGSSINPR